MHGEHKVKGSQPKNEILSFDFSGFHCVAGAGSPEFANPDNPQPPPSLHHRDMCGDKWDLEAGWCQESDLYPAFPLQAVD